MKKLLGPLLLTLSLAVGMVVMTAPAASASTASCASVWATWPTLRAYATRLHYGTGKTGIYFSAYQSVRKDNPWPFPDVIYTFHHVSSGGLQTRYSQPTQWGSAGNPLGTGIYSLKVVWKGRNTNGATTADRSCLMRVGL